MKSICVIGCGWLGTPLASFFVKSGYKVLGTTTSESKVSELTEKGIGALVYRLGNDDDSLPLANVYIINIPPSQIDNYPNKLRRLLNAIPSDVDQILFCSTTSVYADEDKTVTEQDVHPGHILDADEANEARHGTPRSVLLEAEGIMAAHPKTTILRLAGLIGGQRHPVKFLSGRMDIKMPQAPVNIIHRNELIATIATLVDFQTVGEVFNVCASKHPTRMEYYTNIALNSGLPIPEFDKSDLRSGKLIDSSKIQKHIGLSLTQIDLRISDSDN